MAVNLRRLLVVAAAIALLVSSASRLWVTTVRHIGGQGALHVFGTATPWAGYYWPWFGIALATLVFAAVAACWFQVRGGDHVSTAERLLYAGAGIIGGGAMAVALFLGPGGSTRGDAGLLITRNGPLAFVGLVLAASPLIVALVLRPARRALALATAASLVVASVALAVKPPEVFRPAPASGTVPDWRTTPAEPYPFITPVPPQVATPLEGVFDRPPTDTYVGPPRARCTRCPPFPRDAGRSTLTFDRGRYYLSQQERRYNTFGHYVITRTHVTLINDPECGNVRGVYRWRIEGEQLTLTTLFDPCGFGQRARDLTDSAWTLVDAPEPQAITSD